jgi:hypothetical protein
MDSEVSEETTVWRGGKISGKHISRAGEGTREPDSGRASVPGPCAYADRDTTKIFCSPGGGIYQREKRDSDSPAICGEAEKLHRAKLLGEGYYVSTVGRDEATIRRYIREQEVEDKRLDQLEMFKDK